MNTSISRESSERLGALVCETVGLNPDDVTSWSAESGSVDEHVVLSFDVLMPEEQFIAIFNSAHIQASA